MFHLNERVLEKLVSGSAPVSEVERIRHHVRECRSCNQRLEEWRDAYAEVDYSYPELAHRDSATTLTAGGMVVVPEEEGHHWALPRLNFANALWLVALLMALVVGYGANRLRSENDGFAAAAAATTVRVPRPESGTGAGVPMPLAAASDTLIRLAPTPKPAPPTNSARDRDELPASDEPAAPPPPRPVVRAAPARTDARPVAATNRSAAELPPQVAASPSFRSIAPSEATRRLGGALRLLNGLEVDHIEVGPAAAVPGALSGLDVVRIVYRTPEGGRMLLDQQLIPADSTGFHPVDDPTLEHGGAAFGTAPNGVSVATWVDSQGYRISLVAQAPIDSLKQLLQLVK
jgi:hypothetical protein